MENSVEFNIKYSNYLEEKFYGLSIDNKDVIKYLDFEFQKEIQNNPNFEYSQIKMKFGKCFIYSNSLKKDIWAKEIDNIINKKSIPND